MNCRGCDHPLDTADVLCDLGAQPLANALLTEDDLPLPEVHYPLRPLVCRGCLLVQLPHVPLPDGIFTDGYPFFSGQSKTWRAHCDAFAESVIERRGLDGESRVLEIGSNDGTMLRPFRERGVPAVGVEPCAGVAQHALMKGLPTLIDWWGMNCAQRLRHTLGPQTREWTADLVIANNVLAHVPDLKDFLDGVREILAPDGLAVFEVPYVGNLIREGQYDQIYAEHHCYFGLHSIHGALKRSDLCIYGTELIPTHGGSLRVYASPLVQHEGFQEFKIDADLRDMKWSDEKGAGFGNIDTYLAFASIPARRKRAALSLLLDARRQGKSVAGYGASAKATVTLNYCGIGPELIDFVADTTPSKQGKWIPGCRIPVLSPEALERERPDVVVNFAWNWREESEANIRAAVPGATIAYLHTAAPRMLEAA